MQRWEYQTAFLVTSMAISKSHVWRLYKVNEQEQPGWRKTEPYVSVVDFCNQMGQQGWELAGVMNPGSSSFEVVLYFKRLRQ